MLPDSINFQRLTPIIALISHLDMDPDSPLTTTDIRSSLKFAYPSPRAWPISCSVICSISLKPKILPKALLEILILTPGYETIFIKVINRLACRYGTLKRMSS